MRAPPASYGLATHRCRSEPRHLGGQVHALIAGEADVAAAAEELKKYGVAVIWTATSPALKSYTAEAFAKATLKAAEAAQAGIVCASATAQGRDYLPRVAIRRNTPLEIGSLFTSLVEMT